MIAGKKILKTSAGVSALTLSALAFGYSTVFPNLPWGDASMLGTAILIGTIVPLVFLLTEFLHLMILACFFSRFPYVFVFHLLLLAFIGVLVWFTGSKTSLEAQAVLSIAGTAVLLVIGSIVYFRELKVAR